MKTMRLLLLCCALSVLDGVEPPSSSPYTPSIAPLVSLTHPYTLEVSPDNRAQIEKGDILEEVFPLFRFRRKIFRFFVDLILFVILAAFACILGTVQQ